MNYILIVDDHADIRRLLSITLGKQYEVVEADNGTAALFSVRRYNPKVVLLDVMLPGEFDGLQVLDALKSNPKTRDIMVAMITARGQQSDADEAKRRGADAYFIKPFSPLQVAGWIREQLES
jgi:CheY-like chemotaxis protein